MTLPGQEAAEKLGVPEVRVFKTLVVSVDNRELVVDVVPGSSGKPKIPPTTWTGARQNRLLFPKLKPSTKTISLRLPEALLDRIKIEANKRDMPYQSLIKAWLADDVNESRRA